MLTEIERKVAQRPRPVHDCTKFETGVDGIINPEDALVFTADGYIIYDHGSPRDNWIIMTHETAVR